MAVIACPDCSKEFSESLDECPSCSWSRASKDKKSFWRSIASLPNVLLAIAFTLAASLYLIYSGSFETVFPQENIRGDWGAFGDFFGGILNPVFAFLGLIMLVLTLKINMQELSLTRKEMEKSAEALEAQSESLQRQNFESTFFNLLELYRSNVVSMKFAGANSGKESFVRLASRLSKEIRDNDTIQESYDELSALQKEKSENAEKYRLEAMERLGKGESESEAEVKVRKQMHDELEQKLASVLNRYHHVNDSSSIKKVFEKSTARISIDRYFSVIESILAFVKNSADVNKSIDRLFYYELVRSQMSSSETLIVFFALIGNEKYKKLKELITEASLFKSISEQDLYYGINHMRHYDRKAFGLSGDW